MSKHNLKIIALLSALVMLALTLSACYPGTSGYKGAKTTTAETAEDEEDYTVTDEPAGTVDYEVGDGAVTVWKDGIGTNWIRAAVPVKNTGADDLFLSSGTIDIEDVAGTLVQTLSLVGVYPQIIKPGETAYYYEETTFDGENTEGLRLVPHVNVEKAKVDCIRLDVSEVQMTDTDYSGVKTIGRVTNNTCDTASMVYVVGYFYDAGGNLIGQQFTILMNDLPDGEKIGFEMSSFMTDFTTADIASYEMFAFPYQYQF